MSRHHLDLTDEALRIVLKALSLLLQAYQSEITYGRRDEREKAEKNLCEVEEVVQMIHDRTSK